AWALIKGLEAVNGDISDQSKLQDALKSVTLDAAWGEIKLDDNRNGVADNFVKEIVPDTNGDKIPDVKTVRRIPGVEQTFGRTFQTSRLFLGLSVEDNLYLAVLGVDDGHFRLVKNKQDSEMRAAARAMADAVGLANVLDVLVSELSHGEQRQLEVGMARVSNPTLMMPDEPAAGLSRAARVRLSATLPKLDPDTTLLLIEHEM